MKKRIVSLLLSLVFIFSMLPTTALATDTNVVQVTVDSDGYIVQPYPTGVTEYGDSESDWYHFASGYTFRVDGAIGTANKHIHVINEGKIIGGTFYGVVANSGTITDGTFNDPVKNTNPGDITGGVFNGSVTNEYYITGGTFNDRVTNSRTISGGTFNGLVTNSGTIEGGTFNGKILNMGGTVAEGIDATVAEAGDLAITKQTYGTGSFTVKQNGVDIPSGKAGERYNVAGFDSSTPVGLYLLREGESIPTENFEIESEFTAILGGLGGYDFTMPDEAVTIAAVFSDYVPPTTIDLYAMIAEGTSSDQLADGELLYDFEMPTVSGFENGKTLTVDTVGEYITVDGVEHMFAGFYYYSYDESTEAETHSVSDTYEIGIEPADKESDAWSDWHAPISDGVYAVYVSTGHTHSLSAAYSYSETHHWFECEADGCFITGTVEKPGYDEHNFNSNFNCADCGYQQPFTIIPSVNTVKGNGTVTFFVNRNLVSGQFSCSEEHYNHTDFISGGGNHWTFEMNNNVDLNMTFTASHGGETVSCVVSFVQDPDALILTSSHTTLTGPGTVFFTTNKDVDYIDCSNYTYEEYITGSGKEWKLEKTNDADPTLRFTVKTEDGESAMCWVEFISSSALIHEDDSTRIVFESYKGTEIPDNAELVVATHAATIEPIAEFVGDRIGIEYIELDEENIRLADVSFTYNDVTYHINEFVEIDGEKYIITSVVYVDSVNLDYVGLMSLTDGIEYRYDLKTSKVKDSFRGTYKEMSSMVNINGVTYDVVSVINPYELSDEELDADRATYWVLYYNGKPAGRYFPNQDYASFRENCAPATLKANPDTIFLGTVTIPEKDADSKTREDLVADLEAAKKANADFARANGYWSYELLLAELEAERALNEYDAKAQLEAGKAYNVSAVGSNDIHLENAENISGTVTQTFAVPDAYVVNDDVVYVAVHTTTNGNEIGAVNLSEDGKKLTATYTVDSFSPFTVYAFIEKEEPEIKQLNVTIHTEHTDADGDDKCDVCGDEMSTPFIPIIIPSYDVEIAKDIIGGEVSASKKLAYKGDTITLTITPDTGYELFELAVTDSRGNAVAVTRVSDSRYTFKMPGYDVEIDAEFAEIITVCPRDYTCPMYPYTDLDRTLWYHDGIHYCIENGLMQGIGNNQFAPNDTTTRAMIVTILWRLEGSPVVNYAMDFEDVAAEQWYTEAIRWASSEKIVEGYGNGKFGTNDAITREQMVAVLFRYAKYKGYDVSVGENTNILSYDDAFDVAEYAIPAMQWACGSGMIQGIADGSTMNLAPQGNATRAQAAAILQRYCENVAKN